MEKLLLTLLSITLVVSPAYAAFDDITDDLFGAYQNATPGAAYKSQNRYVLAGGSIVTRNPIQNVNLLSVTPPSLNAGCRGISAYGGSFSFINKAQFTQLLRNIASNAVGYAFKLALDTLCPTCNKIMTNLSAKINKINDSLKNSCQAAKLLVDSGDGAYQSMLDGAKENLNSVYTGAGAFTDMFEGALEFATKTEKEVADSSPASNTDETKVINVVWFSINQSSMANWFIDNSNDSKEMLMSTVGTIIKNGVDGASNTCRGNGYAVDTYCYTPYQSTIGFKDILNGTFDKNGGARSIQVLRCDDYTDCLVVTPTTITSGVLGTREKIRALLIGDASNPGIVEALRTKSVLSIEQQKFVQAAPVPVLAMLSNLVRDEGAMYYIASESIDLIAERMASELLFKMIVSVRSAVKQVAPQMQKTMLKQIDERVVEFQEIRNQSDKKMASSKNLMELEQLVRASVTSSTKSGGGLGSIGSRATKFRN